MKRSIWKISLLAVVAILVAQAPALGTPSPMETGIEAEAWQEAQKADWSFDAFKKEMSDAAASVKSAVRTYFRSVLTVAKAIINAIITVIRSVCGILIQAVVTLIVIAAQWILQAVWPG